ncbi:hypothetical protein ACROYT_G027723 [Oculina patagonica]
MFGISLVAELSTDHSQKAVCMISAWIFSENVGGMKLKFGEEIEQQLTDRQPSSDRLFEHPLLQDSKIGERKTWWNSYIKGDAFQPTKTCWPVQRLKERRSEQEEMNTIKAMEAIAGVEHTEEEMPLKVAGDVRPSHVEGSRNPLDGWQHLMQWCWDGEADERPTASMCHSELTKPYKDVEAIPPI